MRRKVLAGLVTGAVLLIAAAEAWAGITVFPPQQKAPYFEDLKELIKDGVVVGPITIIYPNGDTKAELKWKYEWMDGWSFSGHLPPPVSINIMQYRENTGKWISAVEMVNYGIYGTSLNGIDWFRIRVRLNKETEVSDSLLEELKAGVYLEGLFVFFSPPSIQDNLVDAELTIVIKKTPKHDFTVSPVFR